MAAKESDDDKKAGEGAEGAAPELPKKKVSGKKMVLFLLIGLLFIGGGGVGGLYYAGIIGAKHEEKKDGDQAAEEEVAPEEELDEHGKKKGPVFHELPLPPINLQTDGKRQTFLKLKVTLELAKEADLDGVKAATPRIVDSFQLYLRELSKEELQGSAGLERLREELRLRVNAAVSPIKIKDVLFTDILFGDQR